MELRCRCGKVRGTADFTRASRVHVICHCGDCQTWARHLGREEAREVVQTAPSQIRITEGIEHVRCVRLREKSRLVRWYASCCGTPLANTWRSSRAPFVGLMRCMIQTDDEAILGRAVRTNGGERTPLSVVLRAAWFLVVSFFTRAHRPSPFFDASGALIVQPELLTYT